MRSNSPRYVCSNCKNQIKPDDLEFIFQGELKNFVFSDIEIQKHLDADKKKVIENEKLLIQQEEEIKKLKVKINNLLELFYDGQIEKKDFSSYHLPLKQELEQRESGMVKIQSTIDVLKVQSLSNNQVVSEARDLHSHWGNFTVQEKRTIIESVTDRLIINKEDITIKLKYLPVLSRNNDEPIKLNSDGNANNIGGVFCLSFKLLQLCKDSMGLLGAPAH